MKFATPTVDLDAQAAPKVAKDTRWSPLFRPVQPRLNESWGQFRARLRRAEIAQQHWAWNERMDRARGLPADPEPNWERAANLQLWDSPPWVDRDVIGNLRAGRPETPDGAAAPILRNPLLEHLAPWERALPAAPASSPILLDTATLVAQAQGLPPALASQIQLAMTSEPMSMSPATVAKYLKTGGKLLLRTGMVVVKTGAKAIPWVKAAYYFSKANELLAQFAPPTNSMPTTEYDPSSNNLVYRWPDGTVTYAPASEQPTP